MTSWVCLHPLHQPVSAPHCQPRTPHRSTSSRPGDDVMNCGVSDVISPPSPPRSPLPLYCVRRCFIIWAEGRSRLSLVLYSKLWGSNSVVTWVLSVWVCDVVGTHDTCRRVCDYRSGSSPSVHYTFTTNWTVTSSAYPCSSTGVVFSKPSGSGFVFAVDKSCPHTPRWVRSPYLTMP